MWSTKVTWSTSCLPLRHNRALFLKMCPLSVFRCCCCRYFYCKLYTMISNVASFDLVHLCCVTFYLYFITFILILYFFICIVWFSFVFYIFLLHFHLYFITFSLYCINSISIVLFSLYWIFLFVLHPKDCLFCFDPKDLIV